MRWRVSSGFHEIQRHKATVTIRLSVDQPPFRFSAPTGAIRARPEGAGALIASPCLTPLYRLPITFLLTASVDKPSE
jgi:hypothetical protein